MTLQCSKIDCSLPARWRPVLLLRAKGYGPEINPAECTLSLTLCEVHRFETDPDAYISDEAWDMIVHAFQCRGFAEPDRATIQVTMRKLPEIPAKTEGD